jgi:hypothetical protein
LAKRGKGRFCDDVLTIKIPPNLPFPKGGISDIFMLLFGPKIDRSKTIGIRFAQYIKAEL